MKAFGILQFVSSLLLFVVITVAGDTRSRRQGGLFLGLGQGYGIPPGYATPPLHDPWLTPSRGVGGYPDLLTPLSNYLTLLFLLSNGGSNILPLLATYRQGLVGPGPGIVGGGGRFPVNPLTNGGSIPGGGYPYEGINLGRSGNDEFLLDGNNLGYSSFPPEGPPPGGNFGGGIPSPPLNGQQNFDDRFPPPGGNGDGPYSDFGGGGGPPPNGNFNGGDGGGDFEQGFFPRDARGLQSRNYRSGGTGRVGITPSLENRPSSLSNINNNPTLYTSGNSQRTRDNRATTASLPRLDPLIQISSPQNLPTRSVTTGIYSNVAGAPSNSDAVIGREGVYVLGTLNGNRNIPTYRRALVDSSGRVILDPGDDIGRVSIGGGNRANAGNLFLASNSLPAPGDRETGSTSTGNANFLQSVLDSRGEGGARNLRRTNRAL